MKILIGNDTYPPDINGAAYFTKRLAEGLWQRDHEVHGAARARGAGRRRRPVGPDTTARTTRRSSP